MCIATYSIYVYYIKNHNKYTTIEEVSKAYASVINELFAHEPGVQTVLNVQIVDKENSVLEIKMNEFTDEMSLCSRNNIRDLHKMAYLPSKSKELLKYELKNLASNDPLYMKDLKHLKHLISWINKNSKIMQDIFEFFTNEKNMSKKILFSFDDGSECEVLSHSLAVKYNSKIFHNYM